MFDHSAVVYIYIVYEINLWTYRYDDYPVLGNYFFGTIALTKNDDLEKYKYSVYGIGFHTHRSVSLSDGSGFDKNVVIFVADISSSAYVDNRKKYILILGKDPTQGFEDTILTAEKEYAINFNEQQNGFLKECKCIEKEVIRHVTEDIEVSSSDSCNVVKTNKLYCV